MREKWKRRWAHRPRLSRGQRTARNFLLCVPILTLLWRLWGCPLPTAELEFRRMERTHLLPRSEIVFACTGRETPYARPGEDQDISMLSPAFLGIAGGKVTAATYELSRWMVDRYPLEEGPTPAFFGYASAYVNCPGGGEFVFPLMFVNVPREAVRGEVRLKLSYRENDYGWSGPGWDTGNGTWLFPARAPSTGYGDHWWAGGGYTLTLYREDGSLLLEKSGMLGEG